MDFIMNETLEGAELSAFLRKQRYLAGVLADSSESDTLFIFSAHYLISSSEKQTENFYTIQYKTFLGKDFVMPDKFYSFEDMYIQKMLLIQMMIGNVEKTIDEWQKQYPNYKYYRIIPWNGSEYTIK